MSKKLLHGLIDMVPESDSETIYNVLLKFVPTDNPENDELKAIVQANASIAREDTTSISSVDYD